LFVARSLVFHGERGLGRNIDLWLWLHFSLSDARACEFISKMLLHDEVATKLAEQTNRQLYVLSILTALFLPPTLVFGIFGMNTGGLPLTQNPTGTVIALVLGALASLVVWLMLRRVDIRR
jgi:Mg2+ and Co2+ transporter CorA